MNLITVELLLAFQPGEDSGACEKDGHKPVSDLDRFD